MRKMVALSCLILIHLLSHSASEAKMSLSMATGGTAGVYYPLGSALADVINRCVSEVEVVLKEGNGSIANIDLIARQEAAIALVQNDIAFAAFKGVTPFKSPIKNLRMIASLYPEQLQCLTVKNSGIKLFSDLKGKRVSVGEPGSGITGSLGVIFPAAGFRYSEMETEFLNFANTAERMQTGELDAGFILAGFPTAAVTALAEQKEIDLVALEDTLLDTLTKEHAYFSRDTIPAGTYKGIEHDTPTIAVMALLVCDASLPENIVYSITKAIFDNLEDLKPAHDKAKLISLEKALQGASITVHPGAAQYYTEKGLDVPRF